MGAKIRHIAIATQDPDKIAAFFKQALGLKQVGVANSDLATGYVLTDGYINLAILKFKNNYAAYTEGAPRYEGLPLASRWTISRKLGRVWRRQGRRFNRWAARPLAKE
jgi:catechol 2,3-dioxygenase-like lactoylglutathione lyase family enzyme